MTDGDEKPLDQNADDQTSNETAREDNTLTDDVLEEEKKTFADNKTDWSSEKETTVVFDPSSMTVVDLCDDDDDTDDFRKEDNPDIESLPPIDKETALSRLESLIFASPEPITVRRLAAILNMEGKSVRVLLVELQEHYKNRGIILEEISKGFQFRSHPSNAAILRDVFNLKPLRLSKAALEALAIIAYRQPITRAEAEQIRGVDCGGVLKYLFEKNLVRVIGRKEEPGRPIIYGTTKVFLELFGLKSLSDLPALHEFSELWEENQQLVDAEIPSESANVKPQITTEPAKQAEQAEPEGQTEKDEQNEHAEQVETIEQTGIEEQTETAEYPELNEQEEQIDSEHTQLNGDAEND